MIAHQFKPGQVANPLGGRALRREKRDLDREARRLALDHAPEAMRRAVELMRSKDERVATVCIQIILDRAGVRPIDKPEPDQEPKRDRFDPSKYTLEELKFIGEALQMMLEDRSGRQTKQEILSPRAPRCEHSVDLMLLRPGRISWRYT